MKERAYRDPVHGFITVSDPLLLALIDTPEFQRLRRIRQLGATFGTYHGAEHSRFGHSVGCLWIMQQVIGRLRSRGFDLDPLTTAVAHSAALLHDLGHGPFSHALEGILTPGAGHEAWTARLLQEGTAVQAVLAAYDPALPAQVAALIAGQHPARVIVTLISSQIDVDRMDYLIRDSLYTGVTYGRFDLERLINTLFASGGDVVLLSKGIVAAEEYVLARYHMYWQVYLHKTIRGQEILLRQIWRRACDLWGTGNLTASDVLPTLRPFLHLAGAPFASPSVSEFLAIDDHDVMVAIKAWARHPDPTLADLASRFLDRRLLKPIFKLPHAEFDLSARWAEATDILRRRGWDPAYYLLVDRASDLAYDPYVAPGIGPRQRAILALDEAGRPREISQLSDTIRTLSKKARVAFNIYVPEECAADLRKLFTAAIG